MNCQVKCNTFAILVQTSRQVRRRLARVEYARRLRGRGGRTRLFGQSDHDTGVGSLSGERCLAALRGGFCIKSEIKAIIPQKPMEVLWKIKA